MFQAYFSFSYIFNKTYLSSVYSHRFLANKRCYSDPFINPSINRMTYYMLDTISILCGTEPASWVFDLYSCTELCMQKGPVLVLILSIAMLKFLIIFFNREPYIFILNWTLQIMQLVLLWENNIKQHITGQKRIVGYLHYSMLLNDCMVLHKSIPYLSLSCLFYKLSG